MLYYLRMQLFNKILIANRGDIAIRVINVCKELGIRTVAVYSLADKDALHVHLADEKICIGPEQAKQSYLSIKAIMSAAELTKPDAIHPGVGFLSENAQFADIVTSHGMIFIGPTAENIRNFSNKLHAKELAKQYKIPVIPTSDIPIIDLQSAQDAINELMDKMLEMNSSSNASNKYNDTDDDKNHSHSQHHQIHYPYPVMLKSPHCGGGKGMRIVRSSSELHHLYQEAALEAKGFCGKTDLYAELYLENVRHIEFQVCLDHYGNGIHLYERDCSLQRNNQKILEETPSIISEHIRTQIVSQIMPMLKEQHYHGVGTLEFLYNHQTQEYYFMEMNTRLQVEHTITEEVTGVDLVRLQIMMAAGIQLPLQQSDIQIRGHAIQCRINTEDPFDFTPSTATITEYLAPTGPGIRIESAAYRGWSPSSYYDSLLSKLIVHASDRELAFARMHRALSQYIIQGPNTLIPLHIRLCEHQTILDNLHDTKWLSKYIAASH